MRAMCDGSSGTAVLYCRYGLPTASSGSYNPPPPHNPLGQSNDRAQSLDVQKAIVPAQAQVYPHLLLLLVYLVFLYNIGIALLPLIKTPDNLADIPLTPTQRSLLGLDPNVAPSSTPTAQYITPPRYPRSPTPRTSSPGTRSGSASDSPLPRKGSPLGRPRSGGAYSPSTSPMWQKAVGSSRDTTRRNSYGTPSPLGRALGGSVLGAPNTPSPAAGKGASVGLNSKWLYERGRASPRGSGAYS